MELNDKGLERALAEKDEEFGARRAEERRRVPQDAPREDGDHRDVRVVPVVDKLALARELKDKVGRHRDGRSDDGPPLPLRPAQVVRDPVLFDLDERVRGQHADPDDPHVERLPEPPLGRVPVGAKDRVDKVERRFERAGHLKVDGGETGSGDELEEEERRLVVVLVADPERDPDDAEPCKTQTIVVSCGAQIRSTWPKDNRHAQIVTSGEK